MPSATAREFQRAALALGFVKRRQTGSHCSGSSAEQWDTPGRDAFMSDRMRQDAVIRKFEIIGEAVKHLSEETTKRRPDIPWKRIAGMRDHLTHDYFGVDLALVWTAVERDIP
jgi:uncharacterized protein with HEPN domain